MKKTLALILAAVLAVPGASALVPAFGLAPVQAQGNDNEYTPLNSRIRRERPYPTEPRSTFQPQQLTAAGRTRSRNMVDSFARCLWDRSNEKGLDYLARSDLGVFGFEQVGMGNSQVTDLFPISTCLDRVARNNNSGVMLRFTAPSMRQWYIQAAYLDTYPDGPTWLVPGTAAGERSLPISGLNPMILAVLDFADCVVGMDPHAADYFFRTAPESAEEDAGIQYLMPLMDECLPQGQRLELSAAQLRIWMGEGLWHAANNSVPASEPVTESDPALAQPVQGNP